MVLEVIWRMPSYTPWEVQKRHMCSLNNRTEGSGKPEKVLGKCVLSSRLSSPAWKLSWWDPECDHRLYPNKGISSLTYLEIPRLQSVNDAFCLTEESLWSHLTCFQRGIISEVIRQTRVKWPKTSESAVVRRFRKECKSLTFPTTMASQCFLTGQPNPWCLHPQN